MNKKNKKGITNNQVGQLAIEAVLIVILLLSLSLFVTKYMRDNQVLSKMVAGPWKRLAGVMATGNWVPEDQAYGSTLHPHTSTMTRTGD
ncbi:MAG: hypothetical protein M9899_01590 [Bdellovibrionaceae bacterium]|nr:hypothetical protein [Pseudobdellovibrionaceae bacterium]